MAREESIDYGAALLWSKNENLPVNSNHVLYHYKEGIITILEININHILVDGRRKDSHKISSTSVFIFAAPDSGYGAPSIGQYKSSKSTMAIPNQWVAMGNTIQRQQLSLIFS